jgi:hypothetical protein
MIRLGASRGTGTRALSLVSAGVGVGKTVRAGGVMRFTGVEVGNGVAADSLLDDGVSDGETVLTGKGGGVLRD